MAFILDADHVSLLHQKTRPEFVRILAKLRQYPPDDVATTVVTFQEIVQGWLAYLNRIPTSADVVRAYGKLESVGRSFWKMNVVSFSTEAQERFTELRKRGVRIGTLDLRIACIALQTNSVVVSRNLVDFQKVPGLRVEDWTAEL